jgi:hypothetical protein
MKRAGFTEEQIICMLREHEAGAKTADLARKSSRFGFRRLFVLLRQHGEPSGLNRIYRLYREEGLSVRKRRARRRAVGARAPIVVEARPNARWNFSMPVRQWSPLPDPDYRRRRDQGMPGGDPPHLDPGKARGAQTDGVD